MVLEPRNLSNCSLGPQRSRGGNREEVSDLLREEDVQGLQVAVEDLPGLTESSKIACSMPGGSKHDCSTTQDLRLLAPRTIPLQ